MSLVRAQGLTEFSISPYKIAKIFRLRRANDSVLLFPETMTFPTPIIGSPPPLLTLGSSLSNISRGCIQLPAPQAQKILFFYTQDKRKYLIYV